MRKIFTYEITEAVKKLFLKANCILPTDTENLLLRYKDKQKNEAGKFALETIINNLTAAKENGLPICQDTGMAILFCDVGQGVEISGGNFEPAVNEGIKLAYFEGYFRASVVTDPIFERKNTTDNLPAVIYTQIVPGDKIKFTALPKGFGAENMSKVKMFDPSAEKEDIIRFVCDEVKNAGGNPCPPLVLGMGIGGTFDYCGVLAKKALARNVSQRNKNPLYAELEEEILTRVNSLGVGPQGFGGEVTAIAVNIEYFPTHIAGLPVALNFNCHAARHAEITI